MPERTVVEILGERFNVNPRLAAGRIVLGILADVTDRRGWRQAWDGIDADVRKEIVEKWMGLVESEIGAQPTPPITAEYNPETGAGGWRQDGDFVILGEGPINAIGVDLPPSWRLAVDPARCVVVAYNQAGLFVEFSDLAWRELRPESVEAQTIRMVLVEGERNGCAGRRTVQVTKRYTSDPGETGVRPMAEYEAELIEVDW